MCGSTLFLRGNVLVSDSKNCRLQLFSAGGEFVKMAAILSTKPFGLVRWASERLFPLIFFSSTKLRRQDCGELGQFVVVACGLYLGPAYKSKKKVSIVRYKVLPAWSVAQGERSNRPLQRPGCLVRIWPTSICLLKGFRLGAITVVLFAISISFASVWSTPNIFPHCGK